MGKIFAIADIHGCYDSLMALVKQLPITKNDVVVFLGDYVDRGPKTKQVISQMIKWEKENPHWQFLYGNHEDLLLDALVFNGRQYHSYDLWYQQGGLQTAQSYLPAGFSKYEMAIMQPKDNIKWEHLDWLRTRKLYYETDNYFFVHAGIPDSPIEEIKKLLGGNGEDVINSPLKQSMFWARDEFISSTYDWGKKIIFGHTADYKGEYYNSNTPWGREQRLMPIVKKNKIGLDCACCPPARHLLCALELPSEKFYFQEAID